MNYPPRRIIRLLRAGAIGEVLASDSLLNCVACYACQAKCPRDIQLTEVLLPLVKEQVFARLPEVPAELQKSLQDTFRYGNPLGESPRKRHAWTKTSDVPVRVLKDDARPVDVLWYVECYPSYYPRSQDAARAVAKIFTALGIDFAILGPEEKCVGECARLLGEKGLFDNLTEENLATLRKYEFGRIVTSDPHAYDAFKYTYATRGLSQPLEHTVPFVFRHLERLKPLLTRKLDYRVTYHDACCLGRHNGVYEEPRRLLEALPGLKLVEMTHNRLNAICCGGGGGGMWLDTYYKSKGYERLSDRRAKEAIATGADVLAVACPLEVSRFEDSLKVLGYSDRMVVRDVAELVAEAMEGQALT
jgi:Fe-S oxidoreductase